ncbi:hypothetical protein FRC02_006395 [Tulasnella sp. 418]|nr:hypothetical protein FRC02_006395 [Tulasnella sp. 418]
MSATMKWRHRFIESSTTARDAAGKEGRDMIPDANPTYDTATSSSPDHFSSTAPSCFILSLPFDVMHDIFLLVSTHGNESLPSTLTRVCRRWRTFALESPFLWCNLRFTGPPPYDKQLQYLERSADMPLDIKIAISPWRRDRHFSTKAAASVIAMILPHVHRWRRFWVFTSLKTMRIICGPLRRVQAPELQRMALSVWQEMDPKVARSRALTGRSHPVCDGWRCRVFGGGMPKLRKIKLDAQMLTTEPETLLFSCASSSSLRDVEIDLFSPTDRSNYRQLGSERSVEEAILALTHLPQIESLRLCFPAPYSGDLSQSGPFLNLPYLKHFMILNGNRIPSPIPTNLIFRLVAPNLQTAPTMYTEHVPILYGPNIKFPVLRRLHLMLFSNFLSEVTVPTDFFKQAICSLEGLEALWLYGGHLTRTDLQLIFSSCSHLYCLLLDALDSFWTKNLNLHEVREAIELKQKDISTSSLKKLRIAMNRHVKEYNHDDEWFSEHIEDYRWVAFSSGLIFEERWWDTAYAPR